MRATILPVLTECLGGGMDSRALPLRLMRAWRVHLRGSCSAHVDFTVDCNTSAVGMRSRQIAVNTR